MSKSVQSEVIMANMSRDRTASIVIFTDETAFITICGNGMSVNVHLSKEDRELFKEAL